MEESDIILHVIRTGRDIDTKEVWIEYRAIPVCRMGNSYRSGTGRRGVKEWDWAFDKPSAPVDNFRMGYTRYYSEDRDALMKQFLESRKESVAAAKAALVGAEQILIKAEQFCQKELVNG